MRDQINRKVDAVQNASSKVNDLKEMAKDLVKDLDRKLQRVIGEFMGEEKYSLPRPLPAPIFLSLLSAPPPPPNIWMKSGTVAYNHLAVLR